MRVETLAYEADVSMVGTLYRPERDVPAPGVLVFPDIFGLGDHARERAARLAERGTVVLAADYHGDGRILAVDPAMEELARFYKSPDVPCRRGEAALAALASNDTSSKPPGWKLSPRAVRLIGVPNSR